MRTRHGIMAAIAAFAATFCLADDGHMFSLVLNDSGEVICGWPAPMELGVAP